MQQVGMAKSIKNDDGGHNIFEATDGLLELNFPIP